MSDLDPSVSVIALAGSPAAVLRGRIAAELAVDTIPRACPHPAAVLYLDLPSRIMRCYDCAAAAYADGDRPDSDCGPCTACGEDGARSWVTWATSLADGTQVSVKARVCISCGTGTAPSPSLN
jgi:hypothetical protein